ncbi:MAG TPA: membrane-bound PQQ-dependent dehydrogenase, glucose/quinate/shikimate family [Caulobacter sp.]|nr:membrane-bound PQQ-dependent dehydrogenase, glucose/quinate/shikimate family [Caulobacter sp.]
MTSGPGRIAIRLLGAAMILIGLVLSVGGAWLAALGGSPYYLVAGLGIIISAVLMLRGSLTGVWVYLAVYGLTWIWAIWEVGLAGWPLVPRVVAPTVLLVLVIACVPVLRPTPAGRRGGLAGLAATIALAIVAGIGVGIANRAPQALPLPDAGLPTPADASPLPVGADWAAYGGTYGGRRYSPLTQINAQNVGRLKRVWLSHTGDMPSAAARDKYGAETTPLKVGDTLYLCSAKNILIALDPVTGRTRWRHDPQVADKYIPYTAACRGVSYYAVPGAAADEPCGARIFEGTLDGRIIAVDAHTGRSCAGFGHRGEVRITDGMGAVTPGMVSITSAPTIVRGVVVTGHQVLDGQKRYAPSGVIQGYDAVTGELRWAWDMVRPDRTDAPPPGEVYTRGTPNMWSTATGDEALGLVYLPLGNSAADYWSGLRRPEEKAYSSSLVALDVTTGKPVWSFQTVHNDVWDYDLGSPGTLVDFPTAGGATPAIILPSKQGDIYILDRRTGQPLTPVSERRVPGGGVEPEQRSPTQPYSGYHTLRRPDLLERDMWGMSPIDQMICRIQFRRASYDGFYTAPTSDRRWIEYPGYNGGSDWGGVAVDPRRGVIVANYNDTPNYNRLVPRAEADAKGWTPRGDARGGSMGHGAEGAGDPQAGTPYAITVNAGWRMPATGLMCKEPPYGGIRAIDLRTGRTLWDRPLGTARRNGPFGIPSMLPINIGTPNNGGALVTAGNLVFVAAATDNLIRAIDIRTGETVWSDVLPAGGQATPMTYEAGGRQFVVIMAGGHHFMETPIGDEVVAYALPGSGT